jgi:hypothetical protein
MVCETREIGVQFLTGIVIFLFVNVPVQALGPTRPPIQWVPGAPSPEVKGPGA